ncbi:MAG: aldehyde ferredoxin oxidoreductase, partial [Aliifodinibius sp.]|nr:aldehyde ferredoxin oxidoreductase [candidate division Zixibacteria bacterium]NIT55473.1 aldehyde ferredoxin oxidoreductase [Fodinibius sp.]NIW43717.1 aldehyde ferredoxin oxidoreductase [Gammaproteobacteria bacterium]NIR62764.1 aldehyde ferredoxin oxidoreductase [candidate division Zixibacteria bacterium]NIS44835.1 aldehyde ferredoxin oxidoreductase [candidate division Zixibacteria bacterium]
MQPLLKIDLSNKSWKSEKIPETWAHDYLGGASLAARLLYDHLNPEIGALDPQSPLLFINGPLTGTGGPAVGRFVICGRSPATNIWGESNIGGFWGPELRKAGYFGLWITGKADHPTWIHIQDDQVEFFDASSIWGLETY